MGEIVTIISLLLGFSSVSIGLYSLIRANKLSNKLKKITESLSTKYIDKFPAQMDTIVEFMGSTKRSLVMVLDFPAYGCVSNPLGFVKYRNLLDNLLSIKGLDIELIAYSKSKQIEHMKSQFGVSDLTDEIYDRHKEKMKKFEDFFNLSPIKTYEDVFKELLNKNEEIFQKFKENKRKVLLTGLELSMFFWLVDDDRKALFSFYTRGLNSSEITFSSEDKMVINHLREVVNSIKNNKEKTKEDAA